MSDSMSASVSLFAAIVFLQATMRTLLPTASVIFAASGEPALSNLMPGP